MRRLTGHPGFRDLSRFADGELGDHAQAALADHLAGCPRCREDVALIRRARDAVRGLPTPTASADSLHRALARRAQGERVLLPSSDVGAPRPRRNATLLRGVAAALLILVVGTLVVSVRVLEADRPALRISPERPVAGEALRVAYRGGGLFSDQTHLKLRARYRTATGLYWHRAAGLLVRGDDGLYRTEVQLPDSVVYAAFAVETLDGDRLDSNNRVLWDVMVHGPDRQPTLDAMTARLRDLERRDWGAAYEQAREMTATYPGSAQSWATRFSFELSLFDRDSTFGAHRARFQILERRLIDEPRPESREMAWLGMYALGLGELASAETWIQNATLREPAAHDVIEARVLLAATGRQASPAERLREIDALWKLSRGRSAAAANLGWQFARELEDAHEVRQWLRRQLRFRPGDEGPMLADAAVTTPTLLSDLQEWATSWPRPDASADWRPLHVPRSDHRRVEEERTQATLARAAEEAYRHGHATIAASLTARARDLGWDSESLLRLARLEAAAGADTAAAELLARAAADPLTEARARRMADSLAPEAQEWWEAALPETEVLLRRHIMDGAVVRYVDRDVRLVDPAGPTVLSTLSRGRVTVVAFMSRYCAPALEAIPALATLDRMLEARGARLLVVHTDNTDELADHVHRSGFALRILADRFGDARTAFLSSAAPDYFVLDSAGRIRFEHSRLDEIPRQVEAIQTADAALLEVATAD